MVWLLLVAIGVVIAVGATFFYRRAQEIESDIDAVDGGRAPTPTYGTIAGKIRRETHPNPRPTRRT
jgi:hypothetical protein